eukprot:4329981-Amphidinium_carterae.1
MASICCAFILNMAGPGKPSHVKEDVSYASLCQAESRSHIPFRNSKLTYLMEPCLSGHGKTLMLVTIQPDLLEQTGRHPRTQTNRRAA